MLDTCTLPVNIWTTAYYCLRPHIKSEKWHQRWTATVAECRLLPGKRGFRDIYDSFLVVNGFNKPLFRASGPATFLRQRHFIVENKITDAQLGKETVMISRLYRASECVKRVYKRRRWDTADLQRDLCFITCWNYVCNHLLTFEIARLREKS